LPYFEAYAKSAFDALAQERLALVLSAEQQQPFINWLGGLRNKVVKDIYGRKIRRVVVQNWKTAARERLRKTVYRNTGDGVWRRAVEESMNAADFGVMETEYGEYGLQNFLRPRPELLRHILRERQLYWEAQAQGKDLATGENRQPAEPPPATELATRSRKRGPKPDYETAARVAEIVARSAPDGDWRLKLDEVLMALDDENILPPKTWQLRYDFRNWYAAAADGTARGRHLVIEAIKHHLENAKKKPTETIP
jgi:hypothetical protein